MSLGRTNLLTPCQKGISAKALVTEETGDCLCFMSARSGFALRQSHIHRAPQVWIVFRGYSATEASFSFLIFLSKSWFYIVVSSAKQTNKQKRLLTPLFSWSNQFWTWWPSLGLIQITFKITCNMKMLSSSLELWSILGCNTGVEGNKNRGDTSN